MFKTILDNGIEIIQNFDWEVTRKKLCIFMPNYHDQKYTKFSLKNIQTIVPKNDYVVIVGNDNTDDSFEEFENENIFFFSMKRKNKEMRNGCFIRNFVIKRCLSNLFFQKDGEVVLIGDFIKNCIESKAPWRAGKIYVLDENQTLQFMNYNNTNFIDNPTKIIDKTFPDSVESVKKIILDAKGRVNLSSYFHYAYCIETEVLQSLRGYDEAFSYYGFEDSDMFCRLYGLGYKLIPDYTCSAVHLCHPRNIVTSKVSDMSNIFNQRDPNNFVRNDNGWGDGV